MSLIVIEGLDGSGKETQTRLLFEALCSENIPVRKVTFPDYESPSSSLVRMYLAGEFGDKAESVNAWTASTFYAVDRFASYKKVWGKDYLSEKLILADRYTTSNLTYQLSKLDEAEWDDFSAWLCDLEFSKMGLPEPDMVIYLDMLPEVSQKLLSSRYGGNESRKDIHEKDTAYLEKCRRAAAYAAEKFGWMIVRCDDGANPRAVPDIHRDVMKNVLSLIKEDKNL